MADWLADMCERACAAQCFADKRQRHSRSGWRLERLVSLRGSERVPLDCRPARRATRATRALA